jgi:hypothetical protein
MSVAPLEVPGQGAALHRSRPAPRPTLRLVPPPRTVAPTRRDAAYAVTLSVLLLVGVLSVLALNTLMQQQARTIDAQNATLSALTLRQQTIQLALDATDNPRTLARKAAALRMRPATGLLPLRPVPAKVAAARLRAVSAPARGALPAHAG